MSDDDKAKEEAFLNDHFGGGWLGPSPEQVHDIVEHQNDVQVVNDIHTEHDSSAEADGAAAIQAAGIGYGLVDRDPMAMAEAGAAVVEAVMDPHGQEVEHRLGEYGGTSPDGGLPSETGSGSE